MTTEGTAICRPRIITDCQYIIAPELSSFLLIQKAGKYQLLEFEIQKYEKIREIFSEKWKNPNLLHADL